MSCYSIGELAEVAGVSRDTLRYYEKLGLLNRVNRDSGGRRIYADHHLSTLHFIRRAQGMGLSLDEIGQLLQFRENPVKARSEVRELTRQKLQLVEHQLKELQTLRDEMVLLLNLCGCAVEDGSCPIIDSMEDG